MTSFTVRLGDAQAGRPARVAQRPGVSAEELLRAAVPGFLGARDEAFLAAARHVLERGSGDP